MKKFLSSIKPYFLQGLLSVVACLSYVNAYNLGNETYSSEGIFTKYLEDELNMNAARIGTDVDVSTGFDGGALAMGMICCVCIVMIVWIEINKKSKS